MSLVADPLVTLRREAAHDWFLSLQARIMIAFEKLEAETQGPLFVAGMAPGKAEFKPWQRRNPDGSYGGGGCMGMLRGRVFEKAGVHVSHVHGRFPPEFAAHIPGAAADPRFTACGISLIAHPWNPHAPTAHMNTRFVVTAQAWFGGGADLTPMLGARRSQADADVIAFHAAMRAPCLTHGKDYAHYKTWCDEYFHLKHRDEPRGIGGIFYDHLAADSETEFAANFAFTRAVGEAFLAIYPALMPANLARAWSEDERIAQEVQRGRYVEFNLLHDRGTIFGLKTGGNIESILSSLPPRVRWP